MAWNSRLAAAGGPLITQALSRLFMPSTPPLRFSHYRVLQREDGSPWVLGRGAMGLTYKAFDERLRLTDALKVISPERLHERSVQALFLREARSAARVRHSNVASVLALDDTPGH